MLDGSDSAEAVAAVRARIEARDAAKAAAEEAANAEAAEAAAAAAKAPPKKGKQSAEELAAEEAAAAAEAEAAAQAAAAKAAEAAAQAAADDAEIAKANVNWADPSRLEERALPLGAPPRCARAAADRPHAGIGSSCARASDPATDGVPRRRALPLGQNGRL